MSQKSQNPAGGPGSDIVQHADSDLDSTSPLPARQAYGATPEEWVVFQLALGLEADLLPVVSDPGAKISPTSSLKSIGKTPSGFNREGLVVGFPKWTERTTTPEDIDRWSADPRLGLCVQTRYARALDVDIEDQALAADVAAFIMMKGYDFPKRARPNSAKFLLMFAVPGEMPKRVIKTAGGGIEFLGNGQQFVACGTHPTSVRYAWVGGLPGSIQEITQEECLALLDALQERFGVEGMATYRLPADRLQGAIHGNPVVVALSERGMVKSIHRGSGRVDIVCPWEEEHTGPSSVSATSFFPAHTGGHAHDAFVCKHAHCAERGIRELEDFLGLGVVEDFEELPDAQPEGEPPETGDATSPNLEALLVPVSEAGHLFDELPHVVEKWLPLGEVALFSGHGGSGKSYVALSIAIHVALGRNF